MKAFTDVFNKMDQTTSSNAKVAALRQYFEQAPAEDAVWALYFLTGGKVSRVAPTRDLRSWMAKATGLPIWLVEDCYDRVGDLAETLALLMPDPERSTQEDFSLSQLVLEKLQPLREMEEIQKERELISIWQHLRYSERFVWNKLITGGFRVGVARKLVVRALSQAFEIPEAELAHRMTGSWDPTPEEFQRITAPVGSSESEVTRPYPFYLAYPLEKNPYELGSCADWSAEWKWDGIRAQLIRRQGQTLIWSRGEDLVTDTFPEIALAAESLPDGVVLDGEILAWKEGAPLEFGELQRRLGRKKVSAKMQATVPVIFLAYDLLELNGMDHRGQAFDQRRTDLEKTIQVWKLNQGLVLDDSGERIRISPVVEFHDWEALTRQREESRERRVEGFMLKRRDSIYEVGRKKGAWWKWKVEPFTVDAVLIYAQRGHGRRSGLFTDYTFAVWNDGELAPIAKAYSGLKDEEIKEVDQLIRKTTKERFGPVHSVEPSMVFEIAFEGIRSSTRHKAGLALRFPRMKRWRTDKKIEEANTLRDLHDLLTAQSGNNESIPSTP